MKTYYCIPRCTGCGGGRWPTAILVRLGVGGGVGCWWEGCFFGLLCPFIISHIVSSLCSHFLSQSQYLSFFWFSYISATFSFPPSVCVILPLACPLPSYAGSHLQHMPAPVGSSITIYEAARSTGMTCMLFCVVLDIACIMCDIYCVPLALSFFLVADESNVGSLVGQKNSECLIYFSLTHQSATLLSLVVSFGLTIQQVHTGKKINRMCEDSCYSQIFFLILYSLHLPFFLFFLPWLTELSCAALSV